MHILSSGVVSLVLPFFVCFSVIVLLRKIADRIGLVDHPCERKKHDGLVPLVGGIAMFVAFSFSALLLEPHLQTIVLILTAAVVVVLGVLDDMRGLRASRRMLIQMAAAAMMAVLGGHQILQLGNVFGDGMMVFPPLFAIGFTVFCTVGVINAMNMVDGADGLAGTLASISFAALAYLAASGGLVAELNTLLIMMGSLAAFLLFNARLFGRSARIFMGDAGSMLIGLMLAWFFVDLSQGDNAVLSAVSAGWIFGLPLLDTTAVMIRRVLTGRSPFAAGRDHLHHMLIDSGCSVNRTLSIMAGIHALFVVIGVLTNNVSGMEPAMFWLFVLVCAIHLFFTQKMLSGDQEQIVAKTTSGDSRLKKQAASGGTVYVGELVKAKSRAAARETESTT